MSDDTAIALPPGPLRLHASVAMLLAYDAERSLRASQALEDAALELLEVGEDGKRRVQSKDIASIAAALKTSAQLRAQAGDTLQKAQERDLAERLRGNRSGLDVTSPQMKRMIERARRTRDEATRLLEELGDTVEGDDAVPTPADVA